MNSVHGIVSTHMGCIVLMDELHVCLSKLQHHWVIHRDDWQLLTCRILFGNVTFLNVDTKIYKCPHLTCVTTTWGVQSPLV